MIFFGSATITHGGTSLGKTFGGGNISIKTKSFFPLKAYEDEEVIPLYGIGSFSFYRWGGLTISDSLQLHTFGIVVITTALATITLHKCKIFYDGEQKVNVGVNKQQPFPVRLLFTKNDAGNLITFA